MTGHYHTSDTGTGIGLLGLAQKKDISMLRGADTRARCINSFPSSI